MGKLMSALFFVALALFACADNSPSHRQLSGNQDSRLVQRSLVDQPAAWNEEEREIGDQLHLCMAAPSPEERLECRHRTWNNMSELERSRKRKVFKSIDDLRNERQSCRRDDTMVDFVRCECEITTSTIIDLNYPVKWDVFNGIWLEMAVVAEEYDNGTITQKQFENKLSAVMNELAKEYGELGGVGFDGGIPKCPELSSADAGQ